MTYQIKKGTGFIAALISNLLSGLNAELETHYSDPQGRPMIFVSDACGSKSMSSTFLFNSLNPKARFNAVTVLPDSLLWLQTVMIFIFLFP